MAVTVQVRATCPDDDKPKDRSVTALLRITESELVLWYFYKYRRRDLWMRRAFRPFRGPWPIQALLTLFFAPTILFGKQDFSWLRHNDEIPGLRITAFVPREFWIDIHFGCSAEYLAVVDAIAALWAPSVDRETSRVLLFIKKWWRLSGIVIFLVPFFAADATTDGIPWMAIGSVLLGVGYVVIIMLVEVVTSRNDCPPQRIDSDG